MCRSKAEGGARCRHWRFFAALTDQDVIPEPTAGVPRVAWAGTVGVAALWDRYDHAVAAATVEYLARVKAHEPAITADVQAAAAAAGVSTYGLEWRVKSPDSLARKIQDRSDVRSTRRNIPEAKAVREVTDELADVVRYNALGADHDSIGDDARAVCARLRERGWRLLEVEQSYVDDNPYKGLHTTWATSQGEKAELQFQSRRSQAVKDDVHTAYEVMRDSARPPAERLEARTYCCQKYDDIKMPQSLETLSEIEGVMIRKKTYSSGRRRESCGSAR